MVTAKTYLVKHVLVNSDTHRRKKKTEEHTIQRQSTQQNSQGQAEIICLYYNHMSHMTRDMPEVPTIRLDGNSEEEIASELRAACMNTGFFYLENHPISQAVIHEVMTASKEFFDLPLSEKQSLSDHIMSRGYTAMGEETLDPANQRVGDTKEGYYIGQDVSADSPLYNPAKLSGPNIWPGENSCSTIKDYPKWKCIMQNYFSECSSLGFLLTQYIALALGLDKHYFDPYFSENPLAALRLLHYSREKSAPEEGIFACGAHSDYGMLTLLLTDESAGLEIKTLDGKWVPVSPRKGAFIVNLGDMLERWTNGMFMSTVHRVVGTGTADRYSIPFFYEPSFDTVVECLESCCDENNPPKYRKTTSGKHLLEKYMQTHADFSPDE